MLGQAIGVGHEFQDVVVESHHTNIFILTPLEGSDFFK